MCTLRRDKVTESVGPKQHTRPISNTECDANLTRVVWTFELQCLLFLTLPLNLQPKHIFGICRPTVSPDARLSSLLVSCD